MESLSNTALGSSSGSSKNDLCLVKMAVTLEGSDDTACNKALVMSCILVLRRLTTVLDFWRGLKSEPKLEWRRVDWGNMLELDDTFRKPLLVGAPALLLWRLKKAVVVGTSSKHQQNSTSSGGFMIQVVYLYWERGREPSLFWSESNHTSDAEPSIAKLHWARFNNV